MSHYPPQKPFAVGLAGKCPRCGRGPLFKGYLGLRENCTACGLDYARADAGDGPAVFVIFIVGFAAVLSAILIRYGFGAPMWAAFAVSAALAIGLTLALLRALKGVVIAVQFNNKAAEGRLETDD